MRIAPLVAAAALTFGTPALADHHESPSLEEVLAMDTRAQDAARDQYRHPAETLAFFGVEPTMRVVEYGPGGGWYTRVLLPWIAPHGTYMAMQPDTGEPEPGEPAWAERFTAMATGSTGVSADAITAFETDEITEDMHGTVDRILVFRSLHGMLNSEGADTQLRAMRRLLADDGMVGVVQHRAPEDASYDDADGSRGYLRQADVIKLFAVHGFDLVAAAEINANPEDPADWPGGVWTLPPVLSGGDTDRERLEAIGESDRMTLLFRKAD
ncbi:class I SAM-dependent methyltransferase [Aurantiacibacter hainanensis]|uniref:class I SAM-dependent methyltransferase n=1 Tax=Aurantiacibacter hainanensis TaxID=3076114 RepID=UPI0030C6B83B